MNSDEDTDNDAPVRLRRKYREATAEDRRTIFEACRVAIKDGHLPRGVFAKLSIQIGLSKRAIARQWLTMRKSVLDLLSNHPEENHFDVIMKNHHILFSTMQSSRRIGKHKYDREQLATAIAELPLKERQSIRHLSEKIQVPTTTVQYLVKGRPPSSKPSDSSSSSDNGERLLIRHSSALKPALTEINKEWRYQFAMSEINPITVGTRGNAKFYGQYDKVHIDVKWFHMTRDNEKYILVNGEAPPVRRVRHKKYIKKVMFLTAQARPRWDPTLNRMWDGKIGTWPIGYYDKAQRTSVNRPAGTRVWVCQGMGHEKFREMMIDDVIPAIQAKWPIGQWNDPNFTIKIQQDGAGGHCPVSDPIMVQTIKDLEAIGNFRPGKIQFYTQPAR
jgi:hypothetical protein